MISPKAEIDPKAKIGKNVTIYPFAYIEGDVEIGDDCVIYPYVSIMNGTRLGRGNKVFQNTVLGAVPQDFNYKGDPSHLIIGNGNIIRENVVINRATFSDGKTVIGNNNFLMEGVHVSHDTKIGNGCVFGYGTKIAGDCVIEDAVIFSSGVIANPGARVGKASMVQSGCRFSKDVPPYIVVASIPLSLTTMAFQRRCRAISLMHTVWCSMVRPVCLMLYCRLRNRYLMAKRYATLLSSLTEQNWV